MKHLNSKLSALIAPLFAIAAFAPIDAHAEDGFNKQDCTFDGFPLYGNIQVVESFADISVQIVHSFPDLKVEEVSSFPDDCGKWRFVESFPDLKIKYVESFPDVKIVMVASFPGWP